MNIILCMALGAIILYAFAQRIAMLGLVRHMVKNNCPLPNAMDNKENITFILKHPRGGRNEK